MLYLGKKKSEFDIPIFIVSVFALLIAYVMFRLLIYPNLFFYKTPTYTVKHLIQDIITIIAAVITFWGALISLIAKFGADRAASSIKKGVETTKESVEITNQNVNIIQRAGEDTRSVVESIEKNVSRIEKSANLIPQQTQELQLISNSLSGIASELQKYINYEHLEGFQAISRKCVDVVNTSNHSIILRSYVPTIGLLEHTIEKEQGIWAELKRAIKNTKSKVSFVCLRPETAAQVYWYQLQKMFAKNRLDEKPEVIYAALRHELYGFSHTINSDSGIKREIYYDSSLWDTKNTLHAPSMHFILADHNHTGGMNAVVWFLEKDDWDTATGFWTTAASLIHFFNEWIKPFLETSPVPISEYENNLSKHLNSFLVEKEKMVTPINKSLRKPAFVRGLNFSTEDIRSCRDRKGLLGATIELSRACNLRCPYCYAEGGDSLPNELTTKEILKIVNDVKDLGGRTISIVGGGEPIMHPDIMMVLDYIVKLKLQPILYTNSTTITAGIAKELHRLGVSVIAKLNSFNQEVQNELSGVDWNVYPKMLAGIENLIKSGYGDEDPPMLSIETVVTKKNINDIEEIWHKCRKPKKNGGWGAVPYVELLTNQGRAKSALLDVSKEEARDLFNLLAKIDLEDYNYQWEPQPKIAAFQCRRFYFNCYITSIGIVQPCVGVPEAVGNIRQSQLAEIIESPVWDKFRFIERHLSGKCSDCARAKALECYGCRGNVYHNDCDGKGAFGEDQNCWLFEEDGYVNK